TQPQYAAPREEPRRSALPTGLLFGILLFLIAIAAPFLLGDAGPGVSGLVYWVAFPVLLLITGAVASRRYASGARAGTIAAFVSVALTAGTIAVLYYMNRSTYNAFIGATPAQPDDLNLGLAEAVTLAVFIALSLLAALILGLVLGWLGARLFGRRRRRATFG
ncbi:MAG: hypothetical protein M3281_01720, partial [Chloroflexota bacterium]|nr:hypothetical protein [Chloroflexota bacterium]